MKINKKKSYIGKSECGLGSFIMRCVLVPFQRSPVIILRLKWVPTIPTRIRSDSSLIDALSWKRVKPLSKLNSTTLVVVMWRHLPVRWRFLETSRVVALTVKCFNRSMFLFTWLDFLLARSFTGILDFVVLFLFHWLVNWIWFR